VILTNFLFDPFSLEMKLFGTKLYFTCILVHEFEKKKRDSSKNYEEEREIAKDYFLAMKLVVFNMNEYLLRSLYIYI
jgi:hypothetical protein